MRILGRYLLSVVGALIVGFTPPSQAAWTGETRTGTTMAADHVDFLAPVLGPFAYTHFCLRYAEDCRVRGRAFHRPRAVALTTERRRQLAEINAQVNRAIAPKSYRNDTSFDTWRIAPPQGDCNDYAVTKRHELLALGWPSRALLLSEVVTPWGEHHLVLLVRTAGGNFVLDNLQAQVRPWTRTNYQWVRVQLPSEPSLWSTIRDPRRATLS